MTTRIVRLAAFAIGLSLAAPALAAVTPLCGDDKGHDKDKAENSKEKTEKKEKEKDEKKKPTNPA